MFFTEITPDTSFNKKINQTLEFLFYSFKSTVPYIGKKKKV